AMSVIMAVLLAPGRPRPTEGHHSSADGNRRRRRCRRWRVPCDFALDGFLRGPSLRVGGASLISPQGPVEASRRRRGCVRQRPGRGGRDPNAHDPSGATAGAPPPRPRLPLPGLWSAIRPGPSHPRPLEVLGDPVTVLRARHDAEGLVLTARTTPRWLGERLDGGWAIDVLHPLARGSAVSHEGAGGATTRH